jgi:hypothetical protein
LDWPTARPIPADAALVTAQAQSTGQAYPASDTLRPFDIGYDLLLLCQVPLIAAPMAGFTAAPLRLMYTQVCTAWSVCRTVVDLALDIDLDALHSPPGGNPGKESGGAMVLMAIVPTLMLQHGTQAGSIKMVCHLGCCR